MRASASVESAKGGDLMGGCWLSPACFRGLSSCTLRFASPLASARRDGSLMALQFGQRTWYRTCFAVVAAAGIITSHSVLQFSHLSRSRLAPAECAGLAAAGAAGAGAVAGAAAVSTGSSFMTASAAARRPSAGQCRRGARTSKALAWAPVSEFNDADALRSSLIASLFTRRPRTWARSHRHI